MKQTHIPYIISLFIAALFWSCSSTEDGPVPITIPEVDDECCNAEETFLAYSFLNNGYVKEIVSLRDTIDNKYAVSVYAAQLGVLAARSARV